jgi:CBS domain-containing protein
MSPRAACRLETLGFEHVYDYVPGKADWLARGLATEGEHAGTPRAGQLARDDVVTCRLTDRIGAVHDRVEASPYGFGLVVSEGGTVLGRLRKAALEGDPEATADDVMEAGPSTVRADTSADELPERLDERNLKTAIVTTPEGRLIGVVRRRDLGPGRGP